MSRTKSILSSLILHGCGFGILFLLVFFSQKPNANVAITIPNVGFISQKTVAVPLKTGPSVSAKAAQNEDATAASASSVTQNSRIQSQNSYFLDLQKRIQAQQRYPVEAQKRGVSAVVLVNFTLNDQGEITGIHAISQGKPKILVEAGMEAVRAASPFPAPPPGISTVFEIPIEFKIK